MSNDFEAAFKSASETIEYTKRDFERSVNSREWGNAYRYEQQIEGMNRIMFYFEQRRLALEHTEKESKGKVKVLANLPDDGVEFNRMVSDIIQNR